MADHEDDAHGRPLVRLSSGAQAQELLTELEALELAHLPATAVARLADAMGLLESVSQGISRTGTSRLCDSLTQAYEALSSSGLALNSTTIEPLRRASAVLQKAIRVAARTGLSIDETKPIFQDRIAR